MPTKLFIHVEPENHFLGPTDDFVELCRLPLEGGRPYLAQARGLLSLEGGVMVRLKLDLCGTFGEVIDSQDSDYINNHQQFVMTAAATLPAEGGRGGSAPTGAPGILSGRGFLA